MRTAIAAFLVFAFSPSNADAAIAGDGDFFEKRIRPVLHDNCVECHGAEKQKGGLRMDSREALMKGGDSGDVIVPGKADESLLLKAVRHVDKDLIMPPVKAGPKLSDAIIADLAEWIKAGAPWPQGAAKVTISEKEKFNIEARKKRLPWIWQTPQRQKVPEAPGTTDVDRFIMAKLREKNLSPAPLTDDLTWLRRVHFAITGLPPKREQMQAFVSDTSPQRREHVVDALLASPHFGERWARHWMDVVRYAETRGHEGDYIIANAWQYRDYLIRSLNADVPYNSFVAEHIAGDVLPPRINPATGANESVLATGWAFLGEEIHNPVDIRQDECERVDNKVDVLSKAFLGLTVACARCHDHKFDAITQKDYYALCGFVLGSPFRQVRFETMESHARAATELANLRAKHTQKIAVAFATSVRPGVETIATHLLAARRVLFGEKTEAVASASGLDAKQLATWVDQLKKASADPAHPLHFYTMLAHEPYVENPTRFPDLFAKWNTPRSALPPETKIIADFTKPGVTPWKSDGPAFGTRPLLACEVVLGTTLERPVARVMPCGAASSDAYWNRLALAPGTEKDSGNLGAADRAGKTLLTPKFTLGTGRLHYLLRGKVQVYAGVDSHIMIAGGLHERLVTKFDTGDRVRWMTHDLSTYAGDRLHLEFSPQDSTGLDVLMVVEAPQTPAWLPVESWRPKENTASLRDVAEALQEDCSAAVGMLATGKTGMDSRLAPLADWLVQNSTLLGVSTAPVTTAAADFFREQDALAKTIRWDSPTAVSWADGTGVDENILIRGKPTRPGAVAPRGLPEALGLPRITTVQTSGRAELARQLTDTANPLVARVMVNRVWHHLFGRGIVPTVDNFGYLGERPTHPELLDHLAWQFVHDDAWSLKRLIRRLVLTDAFARSSRAADTHAEEIDPSNLLLHRMPVRRLEAESIHDALLVVSGRFDPKLCGPPVPVHLTEFIVGRGRPDKSGPLDGGGRRSIYTATLRNFLPTMMLAFDFPTPFSTVGRRNVTNVPAQSLVMMNDPFVREQASVWAARLLRETPNATADARITWIFETACTRPPTADETQLSLASVDELRQLHPGEPESAVWSEFCHALLNANDFIYLK